MPDIDLDGDIARQVQFYRLEKRSFVVGEVMEPEDDPDIGSHRILSVQECGDCVSLDIFRGETDNLSIIISRDQATKLAKYLAAVADLQP